MFWPFPVAALLLLSPTFAQNLEIFNTGTCGELCVTRTRTDLQLRSHESRGRRPEVVIAYKMYHNILNN